jgi:hypothetical protein
MKLYFKEFSRSFTFTLKESEVQAIFPVIEHWWLFFTKTELESNALYDVLEKLKKSDARIS